MEKDTKREVRVGNEAFKERFQFLLSVKMNDEENIICQRYFKVNGFNIASRDSLELKKTLDQCVDMIREDLVSKSRVLMWYTRDEPLKLTGFTDETMSNPTYFEYSPETEQSSYVDNETLNAYDVTYKFSFLIDENSVYERIWDGTVYPKYVRNGVDLTNSDAAYRDKEPSSLHFSYAIIRHMTNGRIDFVYHIIKKLCEVMSFDSEKYNYQKHVNYGGGKRYAMSLYQSRRDIENEWYEAMREKNKAWSRERLTPGQIEYIDKYL